MAGDPSEPGACGIDVNNIAVRQRQLEDKPTINETGEPSHASGPPSPPNIILKIRCKDFHKSSKTDNTDELRSGSRDVCVDGINPRRITIPCVQQEDQPTMNKTRLDWIKGKPCHAIGPRNPSKVELKMRCNLTEEDHALLEMEEGIALLRESRRRSDLERDPTQLDLNRITTLCRSLPVAYAGITMNRSRLDRIEGGICHASGPPNPSNIELRMQCNLTEEDHVLLDRKEAIKTLKERRWKTVQLEWRRDPCASQFDHNKVTTPSGPPVETAMSRSRLDRIN